LIYAFGEIVLVVVGILIALQINNWNENRINSQREQVILNSLKSELIINLKELNTDYERTVTYHQATINVYDFILKNSVESDSMYKDFFDFVQFTYFFPKTSTYETLKSGNLELIKSDSLRETITDVYETGFKRIVDKVDTRRNAARLLFPYYQKHFKSKFLQDTGYLDFSENIGVPNNYSFLVDDPEFETLVVEAIRGRANSIRDYERTIDIVELCLKQINRYLED
ncbi:DUF6090 family protein, partial [Algoriphagus sp. SE2]|uniref:DUF6090 family protein n=1 Tax=Algoriphagus sp. SE2 TaxID=3141536 RepID=UPI0031CD81C7